MSTDSSPNKGVPYKITDFARKNRKGIVADSLENLKKKLIEKFELDSTKQFKIVLECDGTEIDDEDYFSTLEPHTNLMFLVDDEHWNIIPPCRLSFDQVDDAHAGERAELVGLVDRLQGNMCHVSLLGNTQLELLSDMDPDSLVDIQYCDKIFLEQIKEVSGRFLNEKREAQDAIDLLKIYNGKTVNDDTSTKSSPTSEQKV